jgi:hypothetical protein
MQWLMQVERSEPVSVLAVQVSVSARLVKERLNQLPANLKHLNDIRANMILTAALVEGAALFAIIVGFLAMVL